MTREERVKKLRHLITCLKCDVSGKSCDVNCPTQYDAGNMGEIIENLEEIAKILEQEPRWIPVSERLPEEPEVGKEYRDPSESVLVQLSNGEMKVSRYWSQWRNVHLNNWIDLYSFEEVVAWMPLPKPYSEVEK